MRRARSEERRRRCAETERNGAVGCDGRMQASVPVAWPPACIFSLSCADECAGLAQGAAEPNDRKEQATPSRRLRTRLSRRSKPAPPKKGRPERPTQEKQQAGRLGTAARFIEPP